MHELYISWLGSYRHQTSKAMTANVKCIVTWLYVAKKFWHLEHQAITRELTTVVNANGNIFFIDNSSRFQNQLISSQYTRLGVALFQLNKARQLVAQSFADIYLNIQITDIFIHIDILNFAGNLQQSFINRCHIHIAMQNII